MWPFKKKRLRAADPKDADLEQLRIEALNALEDADKAAQAALTAIDKGAPHDCPEVLATRDAVHQADKAVEAWIRAGGL